MDDALDGAMRSLRAELGELCAGSGSPDGSDGAMDRLNRELERHRAAEARLEARVAALERRPVLLEGVPDGLACSILDMWHALYRDMSDGGLVGGTIIKPRLGLHPRPLGGACYEFWQ
eukprot:8912129-Lingulodinium_polyedra.AAC.1